MSLVEKTSSLKKAPLLVKLALLGLCLVLGLSVAILTLERNTKLQLSYWLSDRFGAEQSKTLFVGSSTIALLPLDLTPNCSPITKRGFSNGLLSDAQTYLARAPLASFDNLVLYVGENDIAANMPIEPLLQDLNALITDISAVDDLELAILTVKPSPLRSRYHAQFRVFNQGLDELVAAHPNLHLIPMHRITNAGLYLRDGIHFNREGYKMLSAWVDDFCKSPSNE